MYCKNCGKEISKNAVFCGNCGYRADVREERNVSSEKKMETKGRKKIWIIGLIVLVLIILISCFIFRNGLFRTGNKEKNVETQNNQIAHTYTEEEIQNMIGKYVDYKPQNNTYVAKSSMTGVTENWFVKETDQIFSTETNMNWRIWSVDNNSIMLISDKPTATGGHYKDGSLGLDGKIGFENGSVILNELCKTCYNNEEYKGIEVRSLSLTDIKKVLNEKTWDEGIKKIMNELNRNLKNVQIDGWGYDEPDNNAYNNPIYFELINGIEDEESYYLSSKVTASGEGLEEKRLYSMSGYQVVENDCIFFEDLYSDDGYEPNSRLVYEQLRPVIIIPFESYELDMSTLGNKTDMWKMEAK